MQQISMLTPISSPDSLRPLEPVSPAAITDRLQGRPTAWFSDLLRREQAQLRGIDPNVIREGVRMCSIDQGFAWLALNLGHQALTCALAHHHKDATSRVSQFDQFAYYAYIAWVLRYLSLPNNAQTAPLFARREFSCGSIKVDTEPNVLAAVQTAVSLAASKVNGQLMIDNAAWQPWLDHYLQHPDDPHVLAAKELYHHLSELLQGRKSNAILEGDLLSHTLTDSALTP